MAAIARAAAAAAVVKSKNAEKKQAKSEGDWIDSFRNPELTHDLGLQALCKLRGCRLTPHPDSPPSPKELHAGAVYGLDSENFPFIAVRCKAIKDQEGAALPEAQQKVEVVFCRVLRPAASTLEALKKEKKWHYNDSSLILHRTVRGELWDFIDESGRDKLRRLILGKEIQAFGGLRYYYKKVD